MQGLNLDKPVDYINTHGTSTPVGDTSELAAISEIFGSSIPPLSSTKSLTGHTLGAAGVHEVIFGLMMMKNNFIAGSFNIEELDPEVGAVPILRESKECQVNSFISNSFGFGGTNGSIAIRKV